MQMGKGMRCKRGQKKEGEKSVEHVKLAHFIPCTKTINSHETIDQVMREVFKHHELLDDIVSDRGSQFIPKFWRYLLGLLQIDSHLSSSYHPKMDDETNLTLEHFIMLYCNWLH